MIQHEIKKLPHSQIEIKVNVVWEDWKNFLAISAEELSKELKIPGFRPGKAPMNMVEQKVGKDRILETAAEKAIQKTYAQIIKEEKLEVIGSPQAEILKVAEGNDLEYKIVSSVVPTVEIKDWKKEIKKINEDYSGKKISMDEKEIEEELKKLAASRAKLITVNRPAQNEDAVIVDFEVKRDGVVIENGTSRNHPLILGKGVFIPGFEEQLLGMKEGEEKIFELSFPKEYHEKSLAGKPAEFKVKVNLVQERQLPEINDEFARSSGKFESLETLKKSLREGIIQEREMRQKEEQRNKFIESLISHSEIDLPEILTHQEIHKMIDEFSTEVQSMGVDLATYLDKIKKTQDDLEKEWKPQAEKRVKAALILEKIALDEEIEVPGDKIEEEMNKTVQFYKNVKNAEKNIDLKRLYDYTRGMLMNEEVFKRLESLK